jgi:hypothetical protein
MTKLNSKNFTLFDESQTRTNLFKSIFLVIDNVYQIHFIGLIYQYSIDYSRFFASF